jgi:hypothetical protein
MRRQVGGILAAVVAVGPLPAALAGPAGARTTGRESFRGVIVAPSKSGRRTVVSSLLVARGIFTAVGRIVEVPNRPGDPDSVVRDDLVFASGRIDIRSTSGRVSMSLNPQTCAFTVRAQQTVRVQGGTGRFRHASGRLCRAGARAWGRRPRRGRKLLPAPGTTAGRRRPHGARAALDLSRDKPSGRARATTRFPWRAPPAPVGLPARTTRGGVSPARPRCRVEGGTLGAPTDRTLGTELDRRPAVCTACGRATAMRD